LATSSNSRPTSLLSARHRVRLGVEEMILCGGFRSGSKIKQLSLAKQFGVGQGVVREALIELQAMGLVESVDNRGIYVTQINRKKLVDSLEVRAAIEGMAVRLCCDRCSRADRRELKGIVNKIYQQVQVGSAEEAASLDREFHHSLVQLSQNDELLRVVNSYRAFGKIVQLDRDPKVVFGEHLSVVEAIEQGDADNAEQLLRKHLWAAKAVLEKKLADDPDFIPHWVT